MPDADKKEWVDWMNVKVLQKAVVIDEAGNILLIRRVPTGPASRPDKWDLPGGNVGPDDLNDQTEPLIASITREVKEETGLDLKNPEQIHIGSWVTNRSVGKVMGILIGYKSQIEEIKPPVVLSPEHYEYKWVQKEEVANFDFGDDGGMCRKIIGV